MVQSYQGTLRRALAQWGVYVVGLLTGEISRDDTPPTDWSPHSAAEERTTAVPVDDALEEVEKVSAEETYQAMAAAMAQDGGATHEAQQAQVSVLPDKTIN